ncbi:MAG TPA: hypothetical protein EYN06_04635 [Myxococcales bacterium]|nr:hypothetical protein [Myxococcales bacterium]
MLCEACQSHDECEDGACIDFASGGRFCLRDCVADPGCPQPGFICQSIEGITFKQCTPLSGACAEPALCQADNDCEFGDICSQGECKQGCTGDGVCAEGKVCSAFHCKDKCSTDNPCPDDQICTEEGKCKIEGGCLEAKECEAAETYCDLESHLCKPGCLQDFDCKASGKSCVDMKCVDKGCTANYVCAFEQVCNLESGQCEKAKGPHCEAGCDPQSESSCGGTPNKCVSLQDKDGNDKGNFCFVACGPDPANKCPQGYQCTPLQDQDGNVTAEICTRDCTVNPI